VGEEAYSVVSIPTRCKRLYRRLRADSIKGSAAIEFAMVAPVFFVLLMGTMEAGIMFFAQSTLQNAVNDTARLVRTGQTACYTTSGGACVAMTQAQFKTKVCDQVSTLLKNCTSGSLQFDVNAYPSGYSAAANGSPLDSGKNLKTLTAFNVGGACDVVLVRAFYKWPVFSPGLNYFMANMTGSYHLLATAAAFRNEPFDTNTGGCT
jgi:Flp pilus assembly protein TadG